MHENFNPDSKQYLSKYSSQHNNLLSVESSLHNMSFHNNKKKHLFK